MTKCEIMASSLLARIIPDLPTTTSRKSSYVNTDDTYLDGYIQIWLTPSDFLEDVFCNDNNNTESLRRKCCDECFTLEPSSTESTKPTKTTHKVRVLRAKRLKIHAARECIK